MATVKKEMHIFNFTDISYEEWQGLLDSIGDKLYSITFRFIPNNLLTHFEDCKGFRIENMPVSRIKSSILKGLRRNDETVKQYLRSLLDDYVNTTSVKTWKSEFEEDQDVKGLFDKLKNEIVKLGLSVQPLTWVKLVVLDRSLIPFDYCDFIELVAEENSQTIIPAEPKKKEFKEKKSDPKEKKLLEKSLEKNEKLKEEITLLREKHKQELSEIMAQNEQHYEKFLENVKTKVARIHAISIDAELSKLISNNKVESFDEMWSVLSAIETELLQNIGKVENVKALEKLMVVKYMLLAGKESN